MLYTLIIKMKVIFKNIKFYLVTRVFIDGESDSILSILILYLKS
ncbi:hypothetical protein SAMN06265346_102252 [Flavobacterium hercynium]|nr:hypothetical protein SAMN06265346_102252 [Flavobacterium hercynium]